MTRSLPPRPEVNTGQPRPPEAPLWSWSDPQPTETLGGFGVPPERGPALETHRVKRRHVAGGTAILCAVFVGYAEFGTDLVWYREPIFWGVFAVLVAYMVFSGGWNTRLAAGSDWLRVRRSWIDTYDLTRITMHGPFFGWMVRLRDSNGRRVRTFPEDLEANRELWALVYNGMCHSAVNGARVNGVAAGAWHLRVTDDGELRPVVPPTVSQRAAALVLALFVAAFVVIGLVKPEWLGPALGIFAILFLGVVLPATLIYARIVRRRFRRPLGSVSSGPRKNKDGAKHRDRRAKRLHRWWSS